MKIYDSVGLTFHARTKLTWGHYQYKRHDLLSFPCFHIPLIGYITATEYCTTAARKMYVRRLKEIGSLGNWSKGICKTLWKQS